MKWDLVLFDLDGTLINTIDDLGTAVNWAMAKHGWPEHSMEEYKLMVGNGIRKLVERAMPQDHLESLDEALADFVQYYQSHIDVFTRPYDGMVQLLQDLHAAGTAVAVTSNKFQAGTEALIGEFFGSVPFVTVLGNKPGAPLKPDPAIVRTACAAAFGAAGIDGTDGAACQHPGSVSGLQACSTHETLSDLQGRRVALVGDSATDMRTAINGGIPGIGVTWGFRSRAELESAGASHIVSSPAELRLLLL